MALPTAQLGTMPSLNMPAYIPTTTVTKEPKAWEKALLAIVANAGSQILGQGVSNAMQQDFAAQNGETPTTGVSKFFSGPRVTRGDNEARQMLKAKLAGDIGMAELNAQPSARDQMMMDRQEMNDIANRTAQMQATRGQLALGREGHQTQRDISTSEQAARKALADAERTFQTPYQNVRTEETQAQTKHLNVVSDRERMQMELQKRMMGDQIPDAKTGMTPRQVKTQARAESMPMPDVSQFPDVQAQPGWTPLSTRILQMVNSGGEPVIPDTTTSIPRANMPPEDPRALAARVVQLRALLTQQSGPEQAATGREIIALLKQLHGGQL